MLENVVQHRADRSARRHADFQPLRAKRFHFVRICLFEVEAIFHGTE